MLIAKPQKMFYRQISATWQAILSCFDFKIETIKDGVNSLIDYLTREFLQGKSEKETEKEK